jgi:hypothetical protein
MNPQRLILFILYCRDPQNQIDFVDALYSDGPFLRSLFDALQPNGIVTAQVGQAASLSDPPEDYSINKNRLKFIQSLISLGFETVRSYEEVRDRTRGGPIYLKFEPTPHPLPVYSV